MCRFLLIKSQTAIQPAELLQKFSAMAKNSKTFDGDWQGDGWGVSWKNENGWSLKKSLKPIWEDEAVFTIIPASTHFLIHARSASFPHHKDIIEFNQPYIAGTYAFVFNGLLKGVALPHPVEGKIGAQKIWNILQEYLQNNSPETSLELVKEYLLKHTKFIQALNIGLSDGVNNYGLCQYGANPEYYSLHSYRSDSLSLLSSEPLEGFSFQKVENGQVVSL